jgi:site-specific DNA-methyltransferase (adenine-specific)
MTKETRQPVRLRDGFQPLPAAAGLFPCRQPAAGCWIYQADSLKLMEALAARHPAGGFDAIFADPPYFLSNGGTSCRGGQRVKVDKGGWDKSRGVAEDHEFNLKWLRLCQQLLKSDGTIWVSGTHHVIFSIGFAMQQLGWRILNDITWEKPNPAPNLGCRCFTHSTETVLWAAKDKDSKHCFNYAAMKAVNGKQMKTVWRFPAPGHAEKSLGRHPTQKPLTLIERCLLASTNEGDLVLDPFLGSGTTAVACARLGRKCVGIEKDAGYVRLAVDRVMAEMANIQSGITTSAA